MPLHFILRTEYHAITNQVPPDYIVLLVASTFRHQYSRVTARYEIGIMVRGNLAISCNFPLVFWAVVGCDLLVVIFYGYWYVTVFEVKSGDGAIPKRDPEPDSVSALTRFDDAGGLSPATFCCCTATRQGVEVLSTLYLKPSASLKRCTRHILTC